MTKRPPQQPITRVGSPLEKIKCSISQDTTMTSHLKVPSVLIPTYDPDDAPTFGINDLVYDKSIDVLTILKPLLDSAVFQRLRNIKQLGPTELLYPGATHTRFAHCLGTYYIASNFLSALRKRYPDKISGIDQLCVCIAALYHDVGHGPLSHLFEHTWEDNNYHHEDMSVKLFDYVIDELKQEKVLLMKYLSETDLQFIREAIRPPKSDSDNWVMKGRPEEKAFLYEFVNNTKSGLDVDKMDYILRDSKHCNFGTRFQLGALDRIIKHAYIDEQDGRTELRFRSKVAGDIRALYEDRERLHQCVYRHRTVIAVEFELQEVFKLTGPYLMIPGKDGKLVALKDAAKDVEAFIKLDDYVITMISNSLNPQLKPAAEILSRLRKRQLMPIVAVIKLEPNFIINKQDLRKYFKEKLPMIADKCRFIACSFHGGLGVGNDPMRRIKFICRNGDTQITSNEWQHSVWWYTFIDYAVSKESGIDFESITNVLRTFCVTQNINAVVSPLYKRNENIENNNPYF